MPQTINLDTNGNPIQDTGAASPAGRPAIDLAPICFRGTFTNPCFWLLIGVIGTLAAQYVLSGRNRK